MPAVKLDPKWSLGAEVFSQSYGSHIREGRITKVTATSVTVTFEGNDRPVRFIHGGGIDGLKMVGQSGFHRTYVHLSSERRKQLLEGRAAKYYVRAKRLLEDFEPTIESAQEMRAIIDSYILHKSNLEDEVSKL